MLSRGQFLILFLSVGLFLVYRSINKHFGSVPRPEIPPSPYWGDGEAPANYNKPTKLQLARPFFGDDVIDNLTNRLDRNLKLTEPLVDTHYEYGFNTNDLREILTYWKDDYLPRWREREIFIWQFPHYTTDIQGLRLHYLHLKVYDDVKQTKKMYPIMLLHGWPSSILEFYNLIPKLYAGSDNSNLVFDIVVPSLPGFGWSQGADKKGMGPVQIAVILRNLMVRIGYEKFLIHGSDWGAEIGSHMATLFPENVLGFHSTMCTLYTHLSMAKLLAASLVPSLFVDQENQDFFFPLSKSIASLLGETGHFHLQSTKPDTIGVALTDNPIGLAAYILEKFSSWMNETYITQDVKGGLTNHFKLDTLIDNIMLYYLTNSIGTSVRLYAEALSEENRNLKLDRVPTWVPSACARFKGDLQHRFALDFQLRDKYKRLVQSTYYRNGGHVAALSQPNALYQDIILFVKKAHKYFK